MWFIYLFLYKKGDYYLFCEGRRKNLCFLDDSEQEKK